MICVRFASPFCDGSAHSAELGRQRGWTYREGAVLVRRRHFGGSLHRSILKTAKKRIVSFGRTVAGGRAGWRTHNLRTSVPVGEIRDEPCCCCICQILAGACWSLHIPFRPLRILEVGHAGRHLSFTFGPECEAVSRFDRTSSGWRWIAERWSGRWVLAHVWRVIFRGDCGAFKRRTIVCKFGQQAAGTPLKGSGERAWGFKKTKTRRLVGDVWQEGVPNGGSLLVWCHGGAHTSTSGIWRPRQNGACRDWTTRTPPCSWPGFMIAFRADGTLSAQLVLPSVSAHQSLISATQQPFCCSRARWAHVSKRKEIAVLRLQMHHPCSSFAHQPCSNNIQPARGRHGTNRPERHLPSTVH